MVRRAACSFMTAAAAALAALALAAALASLPGASRAQGTAPAAAPGSGTCREETASDAARDPDAPAPVYLYCGAKEHRSGVVFATLLPPSTPSESAARRAAVEEVASSSPLGVELAGRMSCQAGSWSTSADGVDLLMKRCMLNDGNWPQVFEIAVLGKFVMVAEGLPAILPQLESIMARLAGYRGANGAAALGGAEDARRRLVALFGDQLPSAAGGDLDEYGNLVEVARMYDSRMNYRAAEASYRAALAIQSRILGESSPGVGATLMSLAMEVSNQGRFQEAAGLFRRADPIVQSSLNPSDRARFYTYLGFDAANQGHFADGLRFGQQASAMWRDMIRAETAGAAALAAGDSQAAVRAELAHALNFEAAMALRSGQTPYAEAAAKEALQIIGQLPDVPPWWRSEILTTMGEISAREGRLKRAEEGFRGALVFKERLFGETAPTAVTVMALGRVYADDGLNEEAVRAFEFALKILSADEVARANLRFDQLAPFLVAGTALAERQPARRAELEAEMFRALQYMSAGVADQTAVRVSARLAAGNPAIEALVRELQDAERMRDSARIELANETALPDAQRGAIKEAQLLAAITQEGAKAEALTRQIEASFPDYAKLAHPGPVELAAIQKALRPREALLLIEVGRQHAAAVVVRADRFLARPLKLDETELAKTVGDLRRAFVVRGGVVQPFDLNGSYALYRELVAPVEAALGDVDQLIVVPSGAIASLPLGLLVTSKPATGESHNYRAAAWLARRFALSVVPSPRALLALRESAPASGADLPFLGLGNPLFTGTRETAPQPSGGAAATTALERLAHECRDDKPLPAELLRSLQPLPDTAGEVETVAKLLGAGKDSVLLGAAATESALLRHELARYRVLYFATHGLLPGELVCQSEPALALSPPPEPAKTKEEDGLLEASEIAALKLNAGLVVLSACNTAEGRDELGGGSLSGLAEAFFFAGARTLVASHWQVPSAATARLMVGMFAHLKPDLSGGIAESLRQAQLALIEQPATSHPFYWAAFTVIGDGARRDVAAALAEMPPVVKARP